MIVIIVLIGTQELYEISANDSYKDSALYLCIADTVIVWDVKMGMQPTVYTMSYPKFSSVGLNDTQTVYTARITTAVTYKNTSHVWSKMIISEFKVLYGYSIICTGMKINLTGEDFVISKHLSYFKSFFY